MNPDTLVNLVKAEGRLPISLLTSDPEEGLERLDTFIHTNSNELRGKVQSLDLPSTRDVQTAEKLLHSISKLKSLRSLTLRGGKRNQNGDFVRGCLPLVPEHLLSSQKLSYLDLSFNELPEIPAWILVLENLCRLQLNFCKIKSLPPKFGNLLQLRELHLKENSLSFLPEEIALFQSLEILNLASNKFEEIPAVVSSLQNIKVLDFSDNVIEGFLAASAVSKNLSTLKLGNNQIGTVDDGFLHFPDLKCLDLRFNSIRIILPELEEKDYVLLNGNPIGYQSPERNSEHHEDLYCVPKHTVDSDACCLKFEAGIGGEYALLSATKITIPKDALDIDATLYAEVLPDLDVNFTLNDLDSLLSGVLELSPCGMHFNNPVKLSLPYSFERNDLQIREIVVRCMSEDGSIEDLNATTSIIDSENGESRAAVAYTTHFSKFAVVARLMEASTVIEKDSSHLLFTPAYPQMKLKFEEGSVNDGTKVTMKVINVDSSIVHEVSENPNSASSSILQVEVSPPETVFRKPVTVRIALPDELLGKAFNHDDLKLFKSAHDSPEWEDVTSITPLHISAVDVSFQVHSFSKYVLVKELFCGAVRYIYRRLRTYRVQFLAMQKRNLPTQVLAQCVLEKKVATRLKQLANSGYICEDATTGVHEMLEGSTYKIQVIGELQVKKFTEKLARRIQRSNLVCRFFSQYPPDKKGFSRFFIENTQENEKCQAGFVSFYRVDEEKQKVTTISAKEVPSPPRSSTSQRLKRKTADTDKDAPLAHKNEIFKMDIDEPEDIGEEEFHEDDHMGDVPIALQGDELDIATRHNKPPDLHFGELGTGMFREENLRLLSNDIGNDWRQIGTFLGLSSARLDQIASSYPNNLSEQIFKMLKTWSDLHMADEDCIEQFMEALSYAGRNDLAHKVKNLHEQGRKEFHASVKCLRSDQDK